MAVELATAYISLVPSLKGAQGAIARELGSSKVQAESEAAGKKAGGSLSRGFKAATAGLLAGASIAGIASFTNNAVAKFSELEDSTAAAGVVFGKNMGQIIKQSRGASKELGLSQQQVISAANTFGTYGKAAGLSGQDLADFATQQTKLAADMASFKGTSPEQAIEAIGAALRGEMEPIRTYGVMLDDASLRQEALAQGLIKTTKDALTPQQKTLAAQALILKQTSDAQGDFARTSESTANVQKTLAAESENLQAKLGKQLAPAFTAVRKVANNVLDKFSAAIDFVVPKVEALVNFLRTGDFTTAFREAFNVEEDSGLVAFLDNVRSTAAEVAGGFRAMFAAFQAGGSDVTSSGFAGVMERIGLAARAAFDYVKDTVIPTAITLGKWLIQNKDALIAIGFAVGGAVAAYKAYILVTKAWAAATAAAAAVQRVFNLALRANPIGLIITAVGALVGALTWFFTKTEVGKKIVTTAWSAIKLAIAAVSTWWTETAWPAINRVILWFGEAFRTAGAVISLVWQKIKNAIAAAWNWIHQWVFTPMKLGIDLIIAAFNFYRDAVSRAWSAVKAGLSAGWNWVRDNVFAPFKTGIAAIGTAFSNVKTAIGKAWDGIKNAAKAPVKFVLETVYNNGIRKWWNNIAEAVGLTGLTLPRADVSNFASGGVLPGYTPGRDVHDFYSPTGGRLALSGGEAIMRPEFTRAVGGAAGVARLNMAARKGQAFANGGVFAGVGDWFGDRWQNLTDFGRAVWDTGAMAVEILKDPLGAVKKAVVDGIIKPAMSNAGVSGDLVKVVGELPVKFAGGLAEKVKSLLGLQASQDAAGPGSWSGGGLGVARMSQIVQALVPGARISSGLRPGAIAAGTGMPSMHASGRAIDIVGPMSDVFDAIKKNYPNSKEIIYSPKGAGQVYKGKSFNYPEPTRSAHFNHVHWGYKNGGVFDQGGWLPPGGVGVNLTRKPEAVLDPEQSAALKAGLVGPLVGTMVVRDEHEAILELERLKRRQLTQSRITGVKR